MSYRGLMNFVWSLLMLASSFSSVAQSASPEIERLRAEADKILAGIDNIQIRAKIEPVFELGKRLHSAGEDALALRYLTKALTHQPWNLEAQLAVGEIFAEQGDPEAAKEKAELVWKNCETDALLDKAANILGRAGQGMGTTGLDASIPFAGIVLVQIGPADKWLLSALRTNLQMILKVPVSIHANAVLLPSYGRNPLQLWAEDMRQRLLAGAAEPELIAVLHKLNLRTNDFGSDANVTDVVETLLKADPVKERLRGFREEKRFLTQTGPQWDAGVLINGTMAAITTNGLGRNAYLGVTSCDLYSAKNRYVFGLAAIGERKGVLSYRRFTALVTDEPPQRQRLLERTLKQALSSVGLMMGIDRCTTPGCPRAYPNNLAEHDAKQLEPCLACRRGFDKSLKEFRDAK